MGTLQETPWDKKQKPSHEEFLKSMNSYFWTKKGGRFLHVLWEDGNLEDYWVGYYQGVAETKNMLTASDLLWYLSICELKEREELNEEFWGKK